MTTWDKYYLAKNVHNISQKYPRKYVVSCACPLGPDTISVRRARHDEYMAYREPKPCDCFSDPCPQKNKIVADVCVWHPVNRERLVERLHPAVLGYVLRSTPMQMNHTVRFGGCYYGVVNEEGWMRGPDGRVWLDCVEAISLSLGRSFEHSTTVSDEVRDYLPYWHPIALHHYPKGGLDPKFNPSWSYDDIINMDRSDEWTMRMLARHNRQVEKDIRRCGETGRRFAMMMNRNQNAQGGLCVLKDRYKTNPLYVKREVRYASVIQYTGTSKPARQSDDELPTLKQRSVRGPSAKRLALAARRLLRWARHQRPLRNVFPRNKVLRARRSLRRLERSPNAQAGQSSFGLSIPTGIRVEHNHEFSIPGVAGLTEILTQINGQVSWPVILKELFFLISHVYQANFSKASMITSVVHFLSNVPCAQFRQKMTDLGMQILTKLSIIKSNAQSGVNAQGAVPHLGVGISLVVTMLLGLAMSRLPSSSSVDALINRCARVGQLITSYDKIAEKMGPMTQSIERFVGTNLMGLDESTMDCWKGIEDWIREAESLQTTGFERRCRDDAATIQKVNTLLQRGHAIGRELDAAHVPFFQRSRVTQTTMFLMQARRIASHSGAGLVAPRATPAVVHFYGDTGVGKSSMLGYLCSDVLYRLGSRDPSDLNNKVYYRTPFSDFWDGFRNGTEIVVCDDFGAQKDSELKPNPQVSESIHMSNTAHFPLSMAHLDDKGTTVFDASLVLWTSNRPTFDFKSVTNPEAVYGRVGLKFKQHVDPEYAVARTIWNQQALSLNHDKLAKAMASGDRPNLDREVMRFDQVDPLANPPTIIKSNLSYEEMSALVQSYVVAQKENGGKFIEAQKNYFTQKIAQETRGPVPVPPQPRVVEASIIAQSNPGDKPSSSCEVQKQSSEPVTKKVFGPDDVNCNAGVQPVLARPKSWWETTKSLVRPQDLHVNLWSTLAAVPPSAWAATSTAPSVDAGGLSPQDMPDCVRVNESVAVAALDAAPSMLLKARGLECWMESFKARPCTECKLNVPKVGLCRRIARGASAGVSLAWRHAGKIAAVCAVLLTVGLGWLAYRYFTDSGDETTNGGPTPDEMWLTARSNSKNVEAYQQSVLRQMKVNHEGEADFIPAVSSVWPLKNELPPPKVEAIRTNHEGFSDQNAGELRSAVVRNLYMITSKIDGAWLCHGTALFLGGRVAMTNRHIFNLCGPTICLRSVYGNREIVLIKGNLNFAVPDPEASHGDKDVVIFECERNTPLHAHLLHHFMTASDFGTHKVLKKVSLVGYNNQGMFRIQESTDAKAEDSAKFQLVDTTYVPVYIREVYKYSAETQCGDCGSVLISFDPTMPRKILGIHMAADKKGSQYNAVGVAIHQEFLTSLLKRLTLKQPESYTNADLPEGASIEVNVQAGEIRIVSGQPGLAVVGVMPREFENPRSSIRPSPVHGRVAPPISCPALLRKHGDLDPAVKALKKAATPIVNVPQDVVDEAARDVGQMLARYRGDVPQDQRVLTLEQSIAGIVGDAVYNPVNRSAGAGFCWPKKVGGKKHWLGADEYIFDNDDFAIRWAEIHAAIMSGRRCKMVWLDTLKDELRPLEKVKEGKTRLFSAGEMVFTCVLRSYFMGFCAHVMRHPVEFESCVGLNPYGEWDKLARRLRSKGPAVVAGDFTNYDGTLCAQILWAVLDLIEEHYETDAQVLCQDRCARRMLWLEIVQSVHLFRGELYEWTHSQPSGCAMTTILNTVYHSIAVRCAYLLTAMRYAPDFADMRCFHEHVAHVNYGDDDVTNVTAAVVDWFNQSTMSEAYTVLGMKYTDETKSETVQAHRALSEVRFLKRAFEFDDFLGTWRAPLPKQVIMEMLNWIGRGDPWELCRLNYEAAVSEAAQLSEKEYTAMIKILEPARVEIDRRLETFSLSWTAQRRIILTRGLPWEPATGRPQLSLSGLATREQNAQAGSKNITEVRDPSAAKEELTCGCSLLALRHQLPMSTPTPTSTESSATDGESAAASGPSFAGGAAGAIRQEITTFVEDGEVSSASPGQDAVETSYLYAASDLSANEITNVLSRPVILGAFDWSSSTGQMGELVSFDLPQAWLDKPMIANKLASFRYARFDLKISVQVNAQAFNAGALILWFYPVYNQLSYGPSSVASLTGITGYPNVQWRCGEETAMELTVPFIGPWSHFDLVTGLGTMGRVIVEVLSPLTGTGDANAIVWAWAENIQFEMPTGLDHVSPVNAQAGARVAPQVAEASAGTLTSLLRTGGSIASSLTSIPGVAPFASAATSLFGSLSGVSAMFGWSKPANDAMPTAVVQTSARHLPNFDGKVEPKVMALDAKNMTDIPFDLLRTQEDEMSFSHIMRREVLVDVFRWSGTEATNSKLWTWTVEPMACNKAFYSPTSNVVAMWVPYMGYISSLFTFWRGSITYHFKFIKTAFHSGRVMVLWIPGAVANTDLTTIDYNAVYKKVYDIRENSDVEFTVPFTWNNPWKQIYLHTAFLDQRLYNSYDQNPTGIVAVVVLNPLRNPSTTASSIDVLVYAKAGDDFQLALPRQPNSVRPASKRTDIPSPVYTLNAQSAMYPTKTPGPVAAAVRGIGEVVTSFRQLLKRGTAIPTGELVPYRLFPWRYAPDNSTAGLDWATPTTVFNWVFRLFRFTSGSMRVTLVKGEGSVTPTQIKVSQAADNIFSDGVDNPLGPVAAAVGVLEDVVDVHLPFYQQWAMILTELGSPHFQGETAPFPFQHLPFNGGASLVGVPESTTIFRHIGEDFNFGMLLGPPVLWRWSPGAEPIP